ncbi:hypothetical protein KTO58_25850 [Chitinophaga pendula]|uniref:hypothetical protein n=1 Tax=Chitinophaga TaxID=79328 RepID=UPI0012FD77D3|nr:MULTISPECIES: hypothetical protein [Chitinophaga]UCJ07051.1 hypothetical protein KTO58_25850 [Chitinophaga pendula]
MAGTCRYFQLGEPVAGEAWLAVVVPLLALPQLTHYILDGFIWKKRDGVGVLHQ